jgi:hypothetical protein
MFAAVGVFSLLGCIGAYVYGYILQPKAFRPLPLIALCATSLALFQLVLFLRDPSTGPFHVNYATCFILVAAVAQAVMALQGRRWRERKAPPESPN